MFELGFFDEATLFLEIFENDLISVFNVETLISWNFFRE